MIIPVNECGRRKQEEELGRPCYLVVLISKLTCVCVHLDVCVCVCVRVRAHIYVCMCMCVYSSVLFIREIGLTLFISGVAQSQCNKQKHVGTSATCIDTDHVHVPSIVPHSVLVCRHLFLPGIGTFSVYTTSVCLVWCDAPHCHPPAGRKAKTSPPLPDQRGV